VPAERARGERQGEELHPSRQRGHQKRGEGYHLTMISHGVEISIAGGVGEMVCGAYPQLTFTKSIVSHHLGFGRFGSSAGVAVA